MRLIFALFIVLLFSLVIPRIIYARNCGDFNIAQDCRELSFETVTVNASCSYDERLYQCPKNGPLEARCIQTTKLSCDGKTTVCNNNGAGNSINASGEANNVYTCYDWCDQNTSTRQQGCEAARNVNTNTADDFGYGNKRWDNCYDGSRCVNPGIGGQSCAEGSPNCVCDNRQACNNYVDWCVNDVMNQCLRDSCRNAGNPNTNNSCPESTQQCDASHSCVTPVQQETAPPTCSLSINGSDGPVPIKAGEKFQSITWTMGGGAATSVLASSSGPSSTSWTGGINLTGGTDNNRYAPNTPGTYIYSISCSNGTAPDGSDAVQVIVEHNDTTCEPKPGQPTCSSNGNYAQVPGRWNSSHKDCTATIPPCACDSIPWGACSQACNGQQTKICAGSPLTQNCNTTNPSCQVSCSVSASSDGVTSGRATVSPMTGYDRVNWTIKKSTDPSYYFVGANSGPSANFNNLSASTDYNVKAQLWSSTNTKSPVECSIGNFRTGDTPAPVNPCGVCKGTAACGTTGQGICSDTGKVCQISGGECLANAGAQFRFFNYDCRTPYNGPDVTFFRSDKSNTNEHEQSGTEIVNANANKFGGDLGERSGIRCNCKEVAQCGNPCNATQNTNSCPAGCPKTGTEELCEDCKIGPHDRRYKFKITAPANAKVKVKTLCGGDSNFCNWGYAETNAFPTNDDTLYNNDGSGPAADYYNITKHFDATPNGVKNIYETDYHNSFSQNSIFAEFYDICIKNIPPPGPFTISTQPSCSAAGAAQVTITWTPSSNAEGYMIYRRPNGTSTWTAVTTSMIAGDVTSYTDPDSGTLSTSTSYDYYMQALNDNSSQVISSNTSSGTTGTCLPDAPNIRSYNASCPAENQPQVTLTWQGTYNTLRYKILRQTGGTGPYTLIATIPGGEARLYTYDDNTVTKHTQYSYKVEAWNDYRGAPTGNTQTNPTIVTTTDWCDFHDPVMTGINFPSSACLVPNYLKGPDPIVSKLWATPPSTEYRTIIVTTSDFTPGSGIALIRLVLEKDNLNGTFSELKRYDLVNPPASANNQYTYTIRDRDLPSVIYPNNQYRFVVQTTDVSGRTSQAIPYSFQTDTSCRCPYIKTQAGDVHSNQKININCFDY